MSWIVYFKTGKFRKTEGCFTDYCKGIEIKEEDKIEMRLDFNSGLSFFHNNIDLGVACDDEDMHSENVFPVIQICETQIEVEAQEEKIKWQTTMYSAKSFKKRK